MVAVNNTPDMEIEVPLVIEEGEWMEVSRKGASSDGKPKVAHPAKKPETSCIFKGKRATIS